MVLIVTGSGGHAKRALSLSLLFKEASFIIPWESGYVKQIFKGKKVYRILSPRSKAKSSLIITFLRTIFVFLHSFCLILLIRPKIILTTGSGIAYPVLMMGKLLRSKTVYIESPSRVYNPSIAGKMLMGKMDLWISTWKELLSKYNVDYMGQLI